LSTITALGFDYGERRIGVAVGQSLTHTAQALVTLPVRNGQIDWPAISRLIAEWRPQQLVLGLPTRDDGQPHANTEAIARFARRLHGRFQLPVAFVDERLSSYAASEDPDTRRVGLDAVAARLILETWLAGC
jgi:putative Holliday junction resolvase